VVLPGSSTVSNETQTYTFSDNTGSGAAKISGTTKLVKKGPATLIIQAEDNNSGPTDIQNGTVQVGAGGIGDIGTGNITNNGALVFNQNVSHQVPGVISGAGPVTQQGSAVLTLLQNNTYKGLTTISSGTLQVGTGGTTGSVGTNAVVDNGIFAINLSGTLTVPTNISGTGALRLGGTANETLSFLNNYQGNTYIDGGVVKITSPDLIPDANSIAGSTGWLVLDGGATAAGTFDLNGFNETVNALSGLGSTVNGVITNSGTSTTATNVLTVLETAGTTYNGALAENPAGAKLSLWLQGTAELRLNGASSFSGPTLVSAGATLGVGPGYVAGTGPTVLSNGSTFYMHANGSTAVFPGNALTIPDNSAVTLFTSAAGNGFGGTLVGGPTATNIVGGTGGAAVSISSLTKQLQSFAGTLVVPAGQGVRFSATALAINGGDNVSVDLEGTINTRNGTGTAGAGVSLGALMGTGTLSGAGTATATTSQYIIGAKGIDTVFSGTINDGSAGNTTIYKAGAGRLTLNGTVSYTGQTTVSNGVLALIDPLSFDASPVINLRSGTAVIDVSGRADGTLNLGNSVAQTLTGLGTIRGSLFEAASSSNSLTLGTLTVTNTATINGALTLQINRTNTPNASELAAQSFVNGGSIALTVNNVGATNFAAGDTFQLFNKAFPGTFTATNLPVLAAPLYWTNNISVNGSIAVGTTVTVNPNPTNITFSVSGNVLTLTWPADHTGWRLQTQTNGLNIGLNTNWAEVAGATGLNMTNFVINPANGTVFYRMVYP
jgi:fibronectin-binding autotransporter adhesin